MKEKWAGVCKSLSIKIPVPVGPYFQFHSNGKTTAREH